MGRLVGRPSPKRMGCWGLRVRSVETDVMVVGCGLWVALFTLTTFVRLRHFKVEKKGTSSSELDIE